jgi:spermidine synthase
MDQMEDDQSLEYVDNSWQQWGVSYHWKDAVVVESRTTDRGTVLEMIRRPKWGMACYMNGEIQSCEVDEKIYHQAFVDPLMAHCKTPRRVMIIGGGEGAMAREVLKWPSVERVDMYEWDKDVVDCFRNSYRQWANGAWDDPRLEIHFDDIFKVIVHGNYPVVPYDVILVDLFEPDGHSELWNLFTHLSSNWLADDGVIGMYTGIRNHMEDTHPVEEWLRDSRITEYRDMGFGMNHILSSRNVYSFKVFIPSFLGEATFLCLVPSRSNPKWDILEGLSSHVDEEIWRSYHTWNSYRENPVGVFHGV